MWKWLVIFTCQVGFTGPFPWASWEGVCLGPFFSHNKHQLINTKLSRILVFPHCPLIKNFHVMVSAYFFDYINTKPGISHYYLKFTLKYWNFWKHSFLEFTPMECDISWERGLGSERISMGHILYLVTKLICESSLTMYVRNRSTFILSWAIWIGISSARLHSCTPLTKIWKPLHNVQ